MNEIVDAHCSFASPGRFALAASPHLPTACTLCSKSPQLVCISIISNFKIEYVQVYFEVIITMALVENKYLLPQISTMSPSSAPMCDLIEKV